MKRYYSRDGDNKASGSRDGIGLQGLYEHQDSGGQYYDKSVPKSWDRKYGPRSQSHGRADCTSWREDNGRRGSGQEASHWRGGSRGRGRGGRPPGLKGKDIGMYYRNLSLKKKQAEKNDNVPTVSIGVRKEREISYMLGLQGSPLPHSCDVFNVDLTKESDLRYNPMNANNREESYTREEACSSRGSVRRDANKSYDGVSQSIYSSLYNEPQTYGEDSKPQYLPAPILFPPSETKPVIGEYKSVLPWPTVKPETIVEPDVFEINDSDDERLDCKSLLKFENLQRDVQVPAVVDLDLEVEEQYSHLKDSLFKRKFLQSITGSIETNLEQSVAKGSVLVQNPTLDEELKRKLLHKQQHNSHYKHMLDFRCKLPSSKMRQQILDLVAQNQVVVIAGETGCGKTTQVGQFILDDFILKGKGSTCHIVCTQPRRISATSVAQRVADERDESLGTDSVGYQIRLERKIPRKQGSIVFCTTGVMLQWMLTDPGLTSISHLILDEIHERDVTSDFVITLLKAIIIKRADLKVILMSATLNADQFSKYFGGCPYINIPGFTFPVKEYYLEDVLQMTGFKVPEQKKNQNQKIWQKHTKRFKDENQGDATFQDFVLPYVRSLTRTGKYSPKVIESLMRPESEEINVDLIAELMREICVSHGSGAILVFLPGWDQISKLKTLLDRLPFFNSSRFIIIPLHSLMPTTVQRSVFDQPPKGVRKIILATNIAETSITIDDVVFVINCGKTKMKNFDVEKNISTLKPEWVSLANARQRRGRAGRVRDGVCFHMYTKGREMTFTDYPLPEMLRTRLEQVILQIKILQIGLAFPFLQRVMDPPDPRAVEISLKMLRTLNALDGNENLTPLGFHLAKLPMDPQTGKMILMAAIFSCVDPVLCVAAGLNFKDPFVLPLGKENEVHKCKLDLSNGSKSDHLVLAEAMWRWEDAKSRGQERKFCHEYFLSNNTLQLLRDMKEQLAGYLHEMNFISSKDPMALDANRNSRNIKLVKAIICAGLYPNVAHVRFKQRRKKPPIVLLHTPEDGSVKLHIRSVNEKETSFESQFLLYHMKLKSSGIYLHDTTMIHPLPLLFFGEGVNFRITNGHEMIHVSDHIYFKCQESTAHVVKVLRDKLDWILENKISHPGTIDWSEDSEEAIILREIIGIITNENAQEVISIEDSDSG